ncbi:hypothetical protein [Amycolatopsis sp. lyj-109]|uniref:hypothetical protein n=1 Tax=Amycolatopsis sp. lyj-109 TaxID=2789287 RepID=UPI00397E6863
MSPRARLLIDVVLAELARAAQEPSDRCLKAVTDPLHVDPASPATLAEPGHRTGAGERTLSRLFGSELSMSFHAFTELVGQAPGGYRSSARSSRGSHG